MKKLSTILAVMLLVLLCGSAQATDINFGGGVIVSQGGTLGSPAVNFSFVGMTITPFVNGGDAIEGLAVSITPDTVFSFTSISGDVGLFSPNHGTLSFGNATVGTLSGDIDFVLIKAGGLPGSFVIEVKLSNLVITGGTSALLSSLVSSSGAGEGTLTFQFSSGGGLNDLLNMGLGVGSMGSRTSISTSVSGSVSVPEPASLALLGTGLLMGGGFVRRKLFRA